MLAIFVFALLACALSVSGKPFQEEITEELMASHRECAKSSGVSDKTLADFMEGIIVEENDPNKELVLCVSKAKKIISEDGKLQPDVLKENLSARVGEAKASEIMETCVKDMAGSIKETAIIVRNCVYGLLS